ncbi:MAG: alpha/beta hydrolase [Myxococcales bacterium]|nr:alpha/beta hydrolase [Myxococcales bacterium]
MSSRPTLPPPVRTFDVGGQHLAAYVLGEGPRLVVLLHGFPDTAVSMLPIAEGLVERGYRCVVPYLRGYSPSALPHDGRVDALALANDVLGLADALGAETFLLVGHDWGAYITYATCNLAPHRVLRAVALSVPPLRTLARNLPRNPMQLVRSRYMLGFQLPIIPEHRAARDDFAALERLWRTWSPGFEPPDASLDALRAALSPKGALTAALDYYRALRSPTGLMRSRALVFDRFRVPICVIVGDRDACLSLEVFDGLGHAFMGEHALMVVAGAGHFLPIEASEEVLARTVAFFDEAF